MEDDAPTEPLRAPRSYGYAIQIAISESSGIGYVVTCRDLPALLTVGMTRGEAVERATNALDVMLTELLGAHVRPPRPSPALKGELLVWPSPATEALLAEYFGPAWIGPTRSEAKRPGSVCESSKR